MSTDERAALPSNGPSHNNSDASESTSKVREIGSLFDHHARELIHGSAIDPEVIRERGYRSISRPTANDNRPREELKALDIASWAIREDSYFPGLLIPEYDANGRKVAHQFKPARPVPNREGKPMKYASQKGRSAVIDVHPRWSADRGQQDASLIPFVKDPSVPLWITEGVKKADSLTSRGAVTIALSGVFNWRNALGGLPDWEDIRIKGRTVYLCFDADAHGKPAVAKAMQRLGKYLRHKGAERVWYVTPPASHNGQETKGADDFFAAGGTLDELKREAKKDAPRVSDTDVTFTEGKMVDTIAEDLFEDAYLWSKGLGWLAWSGTKWEDTPEESVTDVVRRYALEQHAVAAASMKDGLLDAAAQVDGWRGMLSANRLRNITGLTRGAVNVPHDRFDAQTTCLNTPNGYLDLEAGEVRPVGNGEYPTKVTGARFEPDARSAVWEAFLERILPDPDVRGFVQRLFGYSMLGEVQEHIMPIFTGEGANGKGTLRDAVMAAFGDYATEVDPELLMESHNPRHLTFLMELRGRRLVFCSETTRKRKFAEATMKRLVGGDPIQANRMKQDPITFIPTHTLVMCTNHLPEVSGDDPAVWRRICVVPFNVVIPEEERDGRLPRRLQESDVQAAILAWVYEGYQQWQKEGLNPPVAVRARTEDYRQESDLLGRFLEERVERSEASRTTAKAFRDSFAAWLSVEGGKRTEPPGARELGKDLARRGWEAVKSGGVMVYRGMHLASEDPLE